MVFKFLMLKGPLKSILYFRVRVMVFNATFNYTVAVSLLVEETGVLKENHRTVANH